MVVHEIDVAEGTAAEDNANNNSDDRANWWKTMEVGGMVSVVMSWIELMCDEMTAFFGGSFQNFRS